jgi:hypothetical protein
MVIGISVGLGKAPAYMSMGGHPRMSADDPFVFHKRPGESQEDERERLVREWAFHHTRPIALPGHGERPTEKHQQKLRRWSEWYYRQQVLGHTERGLAREYKISRSTVSYGVEQAERLLGLSLARLVTAPPAEKAAP